ncbi:MAG: AAA family ATPase [Pseudomonadota bacterium]
MSKSENPIVASLRNGLLQWINAEPQELLDPERSDHGRFYETGNRLIQTIEASIQRGQHVVLYGPRGCGKSHCVAKAIELAEGNEIIAAGAWMKVQGNKEFSRDALVEDDIVLSLTQTDGAGSEKKVVPDIRKAPLLRRVKRDEITNRPLTLNESDREGVKTFEMDYQLDKSEKPKLFVLFLDEINRFSDGVLDSLLLLLEEGQVVMGGDLYKLPVVVCMTMNPPGYDASARVLSPPLAARIGQSFRLRSPSLNVLSDIILGSRIKEKNVDWMLLRRAALVTLCCWGNPYSRKPGMEYLSAETMTLLQDVIRIAEDCGSSREVTRAMDTLSELCNFGPDGRALGDWYDAAYAEARREGDERGLAAEEIQVRAAHFISVAVRTLGHKIQDAFSQASNPGKIARKENAIRDLAYEILMHPNVYDKCRGLERPVDRDHEMQAVAAMINGDAEMQEAYRKALVDNGLTTKGDARRWGSVIRKLSDSADQVGEVLLFEKVLENLNDDFIFRSGSDRAMTEWLAGENWTNKAAATALKKIVAEVERSRSDPVDHYLLSLNAIYDEQSNDGKELGVMSLVEFEKCFLPYCSNDFDLLKSVADELERAWLYVEDSRDALIEPMAQRLEQEFAKTTGDNAKAEKLARKVIAEIAEQLLKRRVTSFAVRAFRKKARSTL